MKTNVLSMTPAVVVCHLLGTVLGAACAPESARVNGDATSPGALEGYAIVMKLPGSAPAAGAPAPTVQVASSTKPRPALHYCFQMTKTLNNQQNEYSCTFFEYFEDGGKWFMSSEVHKNGAGQTGVCSFGPSGAAMPFVCKYSNPPSSACSTLTTYLSSNRTPASFANVSLQSGTPVVTATQSSALADQGLPLPQATELQIIKGTCGRETAALAAPFVLPQPNQVVAPPPTNGGTPNQPPPSGVTLRLINPSSHLKASTAQSSSPSLIEGSTKCAVSSGATVTGTPVGGSLTPDSTQHYALTNVTVTPALANCTLVSGTAPVYLFAPHWQQ